MIHETLQYILLIYCAFDVRCKSANGLSRCMGEVLRDFGSDGVLVCHTGEGSAIEWAFVIISTHPRIKLLNVQSSAGSDEIE